jgi:hypothetical protein
VAGDTSARRPSGLAVGSAASSRTSSLSQDRSQFDQRCAVRDAGEGAAACRRPAPSRPCCRGAGRLSLHPQGRTTPDSRDQETKRPTLEGGRERARRLPHPDPHPPGRSRASADQRRPDPAAGDDLDSGPGDIFGAKVPFRRGWDEVSETLRWLAARWSDSTDYRASTWSPPASVETWPIWSASNTSPTRSSASRSSPTPFASPTSSAAKTANGVGVPARSQGRAGATSGPHPSRASGTTTVTRKPGVQTFRCA